MPARTRCAAGRLLPVYVEVCASCRQRRGNGCSSTSRASCSISYGGPRRTAPDYRDIRGALPELKIMLTSYSAASATIFNTGDRASGRRASPRSRACARSDRRRLKKARKDWVLSLGIIDGRTSGVRNLPELLERLEPLSPGERRPDSNRAIPVRCFMFPIDLDQETDLDPDLKELAGLLRCKRWANLPHSRGRWRMAGIPCKTFCRVGRSAARGKAVSQSA